MLLAALALTILGFVALVVAVATGTIAFAWVCIIAGIAGFVLLVWDAIRAFVRRRKAEGAESASSGVGTAGPQDAQGGRAVSGRPGDPGTPGEHGEYGVRGRSE